MSFRRPSNTGVNLVRSRIERNKGGATGMKKCDKARYQICKFVDEVDEFRINGRTYQIN